MEQIGARIAAYRKKLGMSQEMLSSLSGLSQSTISAMESNGRDFSVSTLLVLCSMLYVTPNDILDFDGGARDDAQILPLYQSMTEEQREQVEAMLRQFALDNAQQRGHAMAKALHAGE